MSWTDERVETLKKLWQEGHSASQIAKVRSPKRWVA
jgi:GcrA cell cycle regulator